MDIESPTLFFFERVTDIIDTPDGRKIFMLTRDGHFSLPQIYAEKCKNIRIGDDVFANFEHWKNPHSLCAIIRVYRQMSDPDFEVTHVFVGRGEDISHPLLKTYLEDKRAAQ